MRNLALFILNIFFYLIKPPCITNLSLSTTLQTPCTCPEDSIPALTIGAGCFHYFLSLTGGFAHFTSARSSHPDAFLTSAGLWYPLLMPSSVFSNTLLWPIAPAAQQFHSHLSARTKAYLFPPLLSLRTEFFQKISKEERVTFDS